jgi:hypothetical protein
LCEGEVKAIIAARHFGTVAISVPGVDLLDTARPPVERLRPDAIILTYDADREMEKYTKDGKLKTSVPAAHLRALQWVKDLGITPKAMRWWTGIPTEETEKGIDDKIMAGSPSFEILEGEELEANAREIAERFGLQLTPPEKPTAVAMEEEGQIEALFRLARENFEFFREEGGRLYFAHRVKVFGGHRPLRTDQVDDQGKKLTDALRLLFYEDKSWPAKAEALRSVADILRAEQQNLSPTRAVSQRVQEVDRAFYIDLNDGQGNVVEIVPGEDWRIVQDSPARFLRRVGQGRLPMPERGGSVEELFPFLNLRRHSQKQLAVCFIIQALLPRGPYPLMVLEGEQGSGKTSFARVLGQFIDPLVNDVSSIPAKEEEFAVQAAASHLLVYDNVSKLPSWLPDLLCKSSTGGNYQKRQLHTDGDLFTLGLSGPVILTGIAGLVGAADLLERVVYLQLDRFGKGERKTEEDLRGEIGAASPRIFGAILDVLAKALAIRDQVTEVADVRLRDFAKLSKAVGLAMGWEKGFFEDAYVQMQRNLLADSVESSPVIAALVSLLEQNTTWYGTWRELLARLKQFEPNHHKLKMWPAAPNSLSRQVNRAKTVLREIGFEYEVRRRGEGSEKHVYFRRTAGARAKAGTPPEPMAGAISPNGNGNGSSTWEELEDNALAGLL